MSDSTIIIKTRSKSLNEIKVNTTQKTRVLDILMEYAKANNTVDVNRIRFSKLNEVDISGKQKKLVSKYAALDLQGSIESNGLKDGDFIYAKDLGPQIGWRTVFLIEYFGPILINTLFYFAYYDGTDVTLTQNICYILLLLHFAKREYETVFIHQFSSSTMPFFNLFKNCFHYWVLSGINFGLTLFVNSDKRTHNVFNFFYVRDTPTDQLILLVVVFILAELGNFYSHLILARLRSDGSKEHKIPYGFLFNYVTCPNYFFESILWLSFALMTMNWSTWLFFIVATTQMFLWAIKKHKNLKNKFPNSYPKDRKIYIPFVI